MNAVKQFGSCGRTIALSLVAFLCTAIASPVFAELQPGQKRVVTEGEKLEVRGVILNRDGEMLQLRDVTRTDTTVVLTESTSISTSRKGLFRPGKQFDVSGLINGLIVTVDGIGNAEGQLKAEKIRFKDSDFKAAVSAYAQTDPVDDKVDQALVEIAKTDARISSLDEYDVAKVVSVYFAVGQTDLTAESNATLDELAAKAPGGKNYLIEVQGFADSTGDFNQNLALSQQRANNVVQYLAVKHAIPLRRISTPMGYGETQADAAGTGSKSHSNDRRVDVRIMLNKGLQSAN